MERVSESHDTEGEQRMEITRRDFLKVSGAAGRSSWATGIRPVPGGGLCKELRIKGRRKRRRSAVTAQWGAESSCTPAGERLINTGGPRAPDQRGTLCSKGGTIYQVVNNGRIACKSHANRHPRPPVEGRGVGLGPGPDRPQDQGYAGTGPSGRPRRRRYGK